MMDIPHIPGGRGRGDLWMLPSVHHRIVSSDQTLRALGAIRPEVVALELPQAILNPARQALKDTYPAVSVVLARADDGREIALPLSPVDSIVNALRWADRHGPLVVGIDELLDPGERQPTSLTGFDDFALEALGPHRAVRTYREHFESQRCDVVDSVREEAMAARLADLLRDHKSVFAVLGAAHVCAVEELLLRSDIVTQGGSRLRPFPLDEGQDLCARIAAADPYDALCRFSDDVPRVAYQWVADRADGEFGDSPYDKWEAVRSSVLRPAFRQMRMLSARAGSPRAMLMLNRLLAKMCRGRRCAPDLHVLASASRCVEQDLAELVIREACKVPYSLAPATDGAGYPLVTFDGPHGSAARCGDLELGVLHPSIRRIDRKLTEQGAREGDDEHAMLRRHLRQAARGSRRRGLGLKLRHLGIQTELRERDLVLAALRQKASDSHSRGQRISRPFRSRLGRGIDLRGTLRDRLHTRHPAALRVFLTHDSPARPAEFAPVVLDLEPCTHGNGLRFSCVWVPPDKPPTDERMYYFKSLYWGRWILCEDGLDERLGLARLQAAVIFLPWHWDRGTAAAFLSRFPHRAPKALPPWDGGTTPPTVVEKMARAAVDHCDSSIVYVGRRSVPPAIVGYAKQRGKEVLCVDAATLSPDERQSLTTHYLWSPDPDDIDYEGPPPPEVARAIAVHRHRRGPAF